MLLVPFAIDRIDENNYQAVLADFVKNGADFVFFCLFKNFYEDGLESQLQKYAFLRPLFEKEGIGTGIWVNCFSHDPIVAAAKHTKYTAIKGFDFRKDKGSFCPLDEDFRKDYFAYVRKLASVRPDAIMLDDDFRLSVRSYGIGCACKLHTKEFRRRTHQIVPNFFLFRKMFSNGENPLRSAWLDVARDSMLAFAKGVRQAIDEVNPTIRAGFCTCFDTWDENGTDVFELASALAGNNKPFLRTIGAPYWTVKSSWGSLRSVIDYTRMQAAWCRERNIDFFCEGDTYPRPRYVVPSSFLEAYHLALLPDCPNILKYIYDYTLPFGYETGYADHHAYNAPLRKEIQNLFAGKTPVGVTVYEEMHKLRSWVLPKKPSFRYRYPLPAFLKTYIARQEYIAHSFFDRAPRFFSGIPLTFREAREGAVVCFGENARTLPDRYADRGLILDAVAARILTDRAWDVGFSHTPPYSYENEKGQRFYVLAVDGYDAPLVGEEERFFTYALQKTIVEQIEWVSRQALPFTLPKHADLHVTAAKGERSYALGITNCSPDAVPLPAVETSLPNGKIHFIACSGYRSGNIIYLNEKIEPYSFVGLEIEV